MRNKTHRAKAGHYREYLRLAAIQEHVAGIFPVYAAGPDEKVEEGVRIVPAFRFLFEPPLGECAYRGAYGGRGSAKSWQFARALLMLAHEYPLLVLCAREFQSSIADSVHALLVGQAEAIGLGDFYRVTKKRISGANGSEFIFKGLRRHIQEIKSTEGVDICWVEEGQAVSEESWRTLTPTIRKPGSEIWVSFNVGLPDDPTYKRFHVSPPKRSEIHFVGWRDNPYMTDRLHEERADLLERDPEAEEHVWGGTPWMRSDAQVLVGKWSVDEFTPGPDWGAPLFGLDYGYARSPSAFVKLWIFCGVLFVEYAVAGIQWDNEYTADRIREVPGAEDHTIYADSARPETSNELRKLGLSVKSAKKWAGSVADGIGHLRSFGEIIIHPQAEAAIQDARLWRYNTDPRTGDVVPTLHKGNDDTWDAARYALDKMIRRKQFRGGWFPGMDEEDALAELEV